MADSGSGGGGKRSRSSKKISNRKRKKHSPYKRNEIGSAKDLSNEKNDEFSFHNDKWLTGKQNHILNQNNLHFINKFTRESPEHHLYQNRQELGFDLLEELDKLENECYTLRQENEDLKRALFNVKHIASESDINIPEVEIVFKNDNLARHYKSDIQGFLTCLLGRECIRNGDEFNTSMDQMFTIEAGGADHNFHNDRIPLYEAAADEVLGGDDAKDLPVSNYRMKCFNCTGNHSLFNCPETLDYGKIAERKAERYSTTPQSNRYHIHEGMLHSFKPGVISQELRDALQLQPSQIPPYIYRMRVIGYPPGWLEEAEVEESGLILYGKEKADTKISEKKTHSSRNVNYDPEKLINFPGFNVPLPPNYQDESRDLGYPPFQLNQNINLSGKSEFDSPAIKKTEKTLELEDMDVDANIDGNILPMTGELEFTPPLPTNNCKEIVPPPPPTSPPPLPDSPKDELYSADESIALKFYVPLINMNNDEHENVYSSRNSPSLIELEETKERLMIELRSTAIESSDPQDDVSSDECFTEVNNSQTSNSSFSTTLVVSLGSPKLPTFSSCTKVPDCKKFSQGILGHLNFENLPDSTGAYEKVKNVLQKVREKINS